MERESQIIHPQAFISLDPLYIYNIFKECKILIDAQENAEMYGYEDKLHKNNYC